MNDPAARIEGLTEVLEPAALAARLASAWRCVVVLGDRGTGKSTLTREIARDAAGRGVAVACISADPGTPAFGPPGAVSLGMWRDDTWHIKAVEPLCTLDAGRFRLPLVQAVARLRARARGDVLLVDAPGVVRGVAGAELFAGLVAATQPDAVVVLVRERADPPLAAELGALNCARSIVTASAAAVRPDAAARARARTSGWDAYLMQSFTTRIALCSLVLIGTPPPATEPRAWSGRQAALYANGTVIGFGEVIRIDREWIELRLDRPVEQADALLVRDARRREDRLIATTPPAAAPSPRTKVSTPRAVHAPLNFDAGDYAIMLVNGVFGDPLVTLRRRGAKRLILIDLGDAQALSRRVIHRVTDVFITHAHFDHVAGLLWLLRARLGSQLPPCRVYGPPGMVSHIAGMMASVRWDRIGDAGPEFSIAEVHGDHIEWSHLKAGAVPRAARCEPLRGGVLLTEPEFQVTAVELDHGIPVLAFCVASAPSVHVHKDRLATTNLSPGPWLREIKRQLVRGAADAEITLPNGRTARVGAIASELFGTVPGTRVVYATDFADNPRNRRALEAFASEADVLMCEATFVEADAAQALRTQHITTRACGEIAAAARVRRLVPFHFSKRYEGRPEIVYAEVAAACGDVPLHVSVMAARDP